MRVRTGSVFRAGPKAVISICVRSLLCGKRGGAPPAEAGVFVVPSSENIVVFSLAENRLLGEALVRILRNKNGITVAGVRAFSTSATEELLAAEPDVVLLDSARQSLRPSHLVSKIRQDLVRAKVIMVGMEDDEAQFLQAVSEGVTGYILKDASAQDIVRVIRAVATGEAVCPPRLSAALFRCAARQASFELNPQFQSEFGLSTREQQLICLIRQGMTNKEIAGRLILSEQTVKNHIHRILKKTGACDRHELIARCQAQTSTSASLT